MTLLTKKGFCD